MIHLSLNDVSVLIIRIGKQDFLFTFIYIFYSHTSVLLY